jgi:hypothetical protein
VENYVNLKEGSIYYFQRIVDHYEFAQNKYPTMKVTIPCFVIRFPSELLVNIPLN